MHTDIYGNKRANVLADEGAKIESDVFRYTERSTSQAGPYVSQKNTFAAIADEIATWSENMRAKSVRAKRKDCEARASTIGKQSIENHLRHIGAAGVDQVTDLECGSDNIALFVG